MTDKLEALSQPVAFDYQIAGACVSDYPNPCGKWVHWKIELSHECPPDWMVEEGKVKDLKPRYSQEYVTALLAALEEKDQRIKSLADDVSFNSRRASVAEKRLSESHDTVAQCDAQISELKQRAKAAEQREEHLKADAAALAQRNKELAEQNAELEQRPQQPIKLRKCDIGIACEFIGEHVVVSLAAVMVEAATAGFKVEVEVEGE